MGTASIRLSPGLPGAPSKDGFSGDSMVKSTQIFSPFHYWCSMVGSTEVDNDE